jgi:menaquinone reductase, multiheme cytochrome c subunit
MSMTEDKAQEISANASQDDAVGGGKRDDGAGAAMTLFFFIGLVASLVLGWVIFPKLLYSHKEQPIDFNHALHVEEVDDGCQSCHYFREDGTFSGIPKLESCLECHEELLGESDEEVKFYEEYVANNREVPWLAYSRQPDCVFFSHAAHTITGKMDCVSCHGHIGESTHTRVYEQNRISGYSRDIWGKNMAGITKNSWDRMKMDTCSECHVRENVSQGSVQTIKGGCFVCHK